MKKYLFILGIALVVSGIGVTVGTFYGLIPNKVTFTEASGFTGNGEWIISHLQLNSGDKLTINLRHTTVPSQYRGTYESGDVWEMYNYNLDIYIKDSDGNTVKSEQCSGSSRRVNFGYESLFFFVRYDDLYEMSCSVEQWVSLYYEAIDQSYLQSNETCSVSVESDFEVQKASPNIFTLIIGLILLTTGFISLPIFAKRI